jgi:hypothetical protein
MGKFRTLQAQPPLLAKPAARAGGGRGGGTLRTTADPELLSCALDNVNSLEGQLIRASGQPGPGAYDVAPVLPKGGRFNLSKAKSGLEWELYRASQIPGPSQYASPRIPAPSGGRFSSGRPKSDLEWTIHRAKQLPGPTEYDAVPACVTKPSTLGGVPRGFSSGPQRPPTWRNGVPGPGEYGAADPGRGGGGKFSTANAKSDLEWTIHYAKQRPGPASYDAPLVDSSGRSVRCAVVEGGQWNRAVTKSGLEWNIHRAAQLPGPDYDTLASKEYLEGKRGPGPRPGASLVGRTPFKLPGAQDLKPSGSHGATLTPWRQLKLPAGVASRMAASASLSSPRGSGRGWGGATVGVGVGVGGSGRVDKIAENFDAVDRDSTRSDGELSPESVRKLCRREWAVAPPPILSVWLGFRDVTYMLLSRN